MLKRIKISFWPSMVTLTAFILLCKLGFWQLDRAEEKRLWLASFETDRSTTIADLIANKSESLASYNGQKITLSGNLMTDKIMYLDNRVFQGKTGYKVVVPLVTSSNQQLVLVDLGWTKAPANRTELPNLELPQFIQVSGTIKSTELEQYVLENSPLTASWPQRIQSTNMVFEYDWQLPMLPLIIYTDSEQIDGLIQTYKPVIMQPEKHQAYAVQWFLLALASVIVFLFASRIKEPNSDIL